MNAARADFQTVRDITLLNNSLATMLAGKQSSLKTDFTKELREACEQSLTTKVLCDQAERFGCNVQQNEVSRQLVELRSRMLAPQVERHLHEITEQTQRLKSAYTQAMEDLMRPFRDIAPILAAQYTQPAALISRMSTGTGVVHSTTRAAVSKPASATTQTTPPVPFRITAPAKPRLALVVSDRNPPVTPTSLPRSAPIFSAPRLLKTVSQPVEEHLGIEVGCGALELNLPGHPHHGAVVHQFQQCGDRLIFTLVLCDGTAHHLLMPISAVALNLSMTVLRKPSGSTPQGLDP